MRRSVKRLLTSAFAAAGLVVGLGTAASAAPAPPVTVGHVVATKVSPLPNRSAHPDSYGTWVCYIWNLGYACIDAYSNGYDAAYYNSTSTWNYVDFTLQPSHVGDQGAFWAAPGSWHTYFFATGNLGCQYVGVYFRHTGQAIYSPWDCP